MSVDAVDIALATPGDPRPSQTAWGELRRNWLLIFATLVAFCFGAGAQANWLGVMVHPLANQRNWTLPQISLWKTVSCFATMLMAPVVGWLSDHGHARQFTLWGTLGLGLITMTAGFTGDSLPAFYGVAFLFGIFTSVEIAYFRIIVATFTKARGAALGAVFAGSDIGAILIPGLTLWAIGADGIPGGYLLAGALPILSLPFLYAGLPHDGPKLAAKAHSTVQLSSSEAGHTLAEAIRYPAFWMMAVVSLMGSMALGGLLFLLFPYLTSTGISRSHAAEYVGMIGISALTGKLVFGGLIDRMPAALACAGLAVTQTIAIALIAMVPTSAPFTLPLFGFALGAALPCNMYFTPRVFGVRHYGLIGAWLGTGSAVGYGVGPLISALITALGPRGYPGALIAISIGMAIVSAMFIAFTLFPRLAPARA